MICVTHFFTQTLAYVVCAIGKTVHNNDQHKTIIKKVFVVIMKIESKCGTTFKISIDQPLHTLKLTHKMIEMDEKPMANARIDNKKSLNTFLWMTVRDYLFIFTLNSHDIVVYKFSRTSQCIYNLRQLLCHKCLFSLSLCLVECRFLIRWCVISDVFIISRQKSICKIRIGLAHCAFRISIAVLEINCEELKHLGHFQVRKMVLLVRQK